jgi:hypothetical protein
MWSLCKACGQRRIDAYHACPASSNPDRAVTIVVVPPKGALTVKEIDDEYPAWKDALDGGTLSALALPPELVRRRYAAFIDDDGIDKDLPPNRFASHLGQDRLLGPVVFFRMADEYNPDDERDAQSMTPDEVAWLVKYLSSPPTAEALVLTERNRAWWQAHPSGVAIFSYDTVDDLLKDL